MTSLDARAKPPEPLRHRYKRYQKLSPIDISIDNNVFDIERQSLAGCNPSSFDLLPQDIQEVFCRFLRSHGSTGDALETSPLAYEHPRVPGLVIIPTLLPAVVQLSLLDKLLHRHLSHPSHKTNLHMHYNVAYPPNTSDGVVASFFSQSALQIIQEPKDPSVHKPLSLTSCLNRKLRWVTLGGQYDWTQKVYPSTPPPAFPPDVSALVSGLFPDMIPQAAIVNFYTPGDTLSLHRDVSEHCDSPLVSISLGCDGLFVAGLDDTSDGSDNSIVVRLRSGDAVVMSGPARYAWHGVPQILPDTCPHWMQEWPASSSRGPSQSDDDEFEHWRGWMARKRINLNVRQMWG